VKILRNLKDNFVHVHVIEQGCKTDFLLRI